MISGINLLPWRDERRQRQRRTAITIDVIFLSVTAMGIGGVWWKQNADISYQNSRNKFLKQAISRVERQLQEIKDIQKRKEELMARMEVINRLQAERPKLVRGMMELATSMPEGIFFSSLKRTPDGISFT